jgi:centromeric protein E
LGKKDPGHINYRDSKLTRILKPSLSGNARMSAICCISPMIQFQDESKSTLDFASRTMLVTTNASKNETVEYDDAIVGEFEKEIDRLKTETANAEKGQQQLAVSLQESAEQIVCLMATIEIEKSKVASLEKQNYEFMMQVEELTLLNEELKATEQKQSPCGDKDLLKSVEALKSHNEDLEMRVSELVEEKAQLEFRLKREMNNAEKRKDAALEKRKRFKSKLGDMKARLRDDITGGAGSHLDRVVE